MNAANAIAETYQIPIIYSTHPRSRKFIEKRNFKFHPLVRTLKPFYFYDYNYLQQNESSEVSDSGTFLEEASYFKFPTVSVRTNIEKSETLDKGKFTIGSITTEQCYRQLYSYRYE